MKLPLWTSWPVATQLESCNVRLLSLLSPGLGNLVNKDVNAIIKFACNAFRINFRALQYVYPYGATLNVAKPSTAVLSTGSACIPVNRPVLGFYKSKVSI